MTNQSNKKVLGCLEILTVNTTATTVDTGEDLRMVSTVDTASTGSTNTDDFLVKPIRVRPWRKGSSAWIYMAAGIIVWDVLAEEEEMLTYAFRRGIHTRGVIVCLAWIIVTAHLFEIIPSQIDPIHQTGMALRNATHKRRDNG